MPKSAGAAWPRLGTCLRCRTWTRPGYGNRLLKGTWPDRPWSGPHLQKAACLTTWLAKARQLGSWLDGCYRLPVAVVTARAVPVALARLGAGPTVVAAISRHGSLLIASLFSRWLFAFYWVVEAPLTHPVPGEAASAAVSYCGLSFSGSSAPASCGRPSKVSRQSGVTGGSWCYCCWRRCALPPGPRLARSPVALPSSRDVACR